MGRTANPRVALCKSCHGPASTKAVARYTPRMYPLLLLWACETTQPSGQIFAPVAPPAPVAPAPDPEWTIPPAVPEAVIPSEKLQEPETAKAPAKDLFGNAVTAPAESEKPEETPAPSVAAPAVGLPSDPWPVRLVATLPSAQPPRAILGLPSGEERVVSPGSILPDQGLVVMSVSGDRVQLAKIAANGDHATIQNLELTSQYPAH